MYFVFKYYKLTNINSIKTVDVDFSSDIHPEMVIFKNLQYDFLCNNT